MRPTKAEKKFNLNEKKNLEEVERDKWKNEPHAAKDIQL